ncbi:MAG: TetR/AcrR family transcriptional regulator [Oscillospiraceae bacterium]|jgi:AcrR family transcriptional regulator|nr:TetR/AcrR family transcriptional regulator [Oscillospiraceae bacterium]
MENMTGTKKRIFEVAADMFAKDSYHAVSMRQIANAVNIKASSIYNHFESKEALLLTIYEYFDSHMRMLKPDLSKLMEMVETHHPHDVLRATNIIYPGEIVQTMSRAMLITASQASSDPRAEAIIYRNMIEMPGTYDVPILNKMMALDKIEPLDPHDFSLIHSGYCYSAAVRFYSNRSIDNPRYLAGLDMIFTIVRVKEGGARRCEKVAKNT